MLIILGGLPGTGKTTLARELARQIAATYLRIDSIEKVLRQPPGDEGYRVAYEVAGDNLRLGRTVIADSVNPIAVTRDAWIAVAKRTNVGYTEIEVICSDVEEHRRRVESREMPGWQEVVSRDYQPWSREHVVIDTAGQSVESSVRQLRRVLPPLK